MLNRCAVALLASVFAVSLLACGSSGESSDPSVDDAEVAQEIRGGPSYTLRSEAILGKYTSSEGCPGGFDVCEDIEVAPKEGGGVEVKLGMFNQYVAARVWQSRGVVLFESENDLAIDCQDPGCGDLFRVTGVIYPVKKGNRWVPQIKATVYTEFRFPDEEGAPEGEIKSVVRFSKTR